MQNANEKQNNTNPNDKYTPEEYLSETNIKNKEEAKRYLKELKIIFWVHLISLSFLYSSNESGNESAFVFFIFYICILGVFIYFCIKLLKVEKIPTGNAWFCVVFAPISWLYLYPLLANPLKIILGEKQPPIRISNEKRRETYEKSKKHWKKVSIVLGILVSLWLLSVIINFILYR